MSHNIKILILTVITALLLSVLACYGCSTNHQIRVYSQNYRLTGYNSAYDVNCFYLTTQTLYYIILQDKRSTNVTNKSNVPKVD